jgi:hypothetical protein
MTYGAVVKVLAPIQAYEASHAPTCRVLSPRGLCSSRWA